MPEHGDRCPGGGAVVGRGGVGAAAAAQDNDDATALYQQLTGPWREALTSRLQAAADAGQLRPGTRLDAAADTLTGALISPILSLASPAMSVPRASPSSPARNSRHCEPPPWHSTKA